jgi:membrane-bound lytic murein transglycosylase F
MFAVSCSYLHTGSKTSKPGHIAIDLDSIRARGKLIAVTDVNSMNYFIYKGEPMGFTYELLKSFTDHLGLGLEIITENQLDEAFKTLYSGKADLLAIGLTVNSSRKQEVSFTEPIEETRQVLVQRKPHNWRSLTADQINRKLLRNQLDLANKTVYVQSGSSHVERLKTLSEEIGDSIHIVEVPYNSEKLIQNVANGEIDYTVCDQNVSKVIATYYKNIDVNTPVSFPQNIAWAVRKNYSDSLLKELDNWILSYRKTSAYAFLYAKYFRNSRMSHIVNSDYFPINTGKLSRYDDLIKKYSATIKWDWRLLASLVCQESHFNPGVKSWAGAYGLMQIMPVTAREFGIDVKASPENNIKAGIKYIKYLNSVFASKIPDESERIHFILASYNAGPGHVIDAMNLAEKYGMDPHKWYGNVAVWMLKKSDPKYFKDPVVKSGYFKGIESVAFVTEVLDRYEHYKNLVPDGAMDSYEFLASAERK